MHVFNTGLAFLDTPDFAFALASGWSDPKSIKWMDAHTFESFLYKFIKKGVSKPAEMPRHPRSKPFDSAHTLLDNVPSNSSLDLLWITEGTLSKSIRNLAQKNITHALFDFRIAR